MQTEGRDVRQAILQFVEVAGAVAVVYGLGLLAVWLAWVVGGMLLMAAAVAVERGDG